MGYLEVEISGNCAISANGVDLGTSIGCLNSLFRSPDYPELSVYIDALENEGWQLMGSKTNSTFGMIDGMPFGGRRETLVFRGNGRYEIVWNESQTRWHFKGYRVDDYYQDDNDY